MVRGLPHSAEELIRWYERYVSPLSLLVGFSIDAFAAKALDLSLYSFVLLAHLITAAVGIAVLHLVESGRLRYPSIVSTAQFLPVVVQYSFGALFSGFLILYSRSASFAVTWMFVACLATLLLGNERFRKLYVTLPVQIGIFFFAFFSFTIFYVPLALGSVGPRLFFASAGVSFAAIALYLFVFARATPTLFQDQKTSIARAVVGVFSMIALLYGLGAIPPLPLALRDAGVFHSVMKSEDEYIVTYEPVPWYEAYTRYRTTFNRMPGEPIYVYSAVYAPRGIALGIVHEWQYYDPTNGWETRARHEFPISGGREGGYRGYTLKRDVEFGLWRVNIETDYGALIGRVSFEVREAARTPDLATDTR